LKQTKIFTQAVCDTKEPLQLWYVACGTV